MNKRFVSQKRYYDNLVFDSGAEVIAYQRLKSMPERVQNLQYHPPSIVLKDHDIVITTYKPDFTYFDAALGIDIICEFKGLSYFNNQDFRLKMKMLGARGIDIDIFIIQSGQARYWITSTMLAKGLHRIPINLNILRQNIFGSQVFVCPQGSYSKPIKK